MYNSRNSFRSDLNIRWFEAGPSSINRFRTCVPYFQESSFIEPHKERCTKTVNIPNKDIMIYDKLVHKIPEDKIGISADTTCLIHDNMIYMLTRLGERNDVEIIMVNNVRQKIKTKYFFYRVGETSDVMFGVSPVSTLYFKFHNSDDGLKFIRINYLGKNFK
jgi:hypothetical protein